MISNKMSYGGGDGKASFRVIRNVSYNFLQTLCNIGIQLLGRMIFVRVLNSSYLGIQGLFSTVLSVLSLADMGMQTAMMYHLYRPINENDQNQIAKLVNFFKKIYNLIASSVLTFGLLLIPFLKYIINLEQEISHLYVYYLISLLNVVISYLFVYRTTLITADQKNYILSKYVIRFNLLSFVLQNITLLLFRNYILYLLTALIVNLASNLYQNHIAMNLYPYLRNEVAPLDNAERKSVFLDIKALFVTRLCGVIQNNTDSILISVFAGTVYVGYYSNYILITQAVTVFLNIVFKSLKATVGAYFADDTFGIEKKVRLFWMGEFLDFWITGFCTICIFVLSNSFIRLFFGTEYVLDMPIVVAICAFFYISNVRQNLWIYREVTGAFAQTRHVSVVVGILNIVFSLCFGYFYGMSGVLYATILAHVAFGWWREPQIIFKIVFNRRPISYYKQYISRLLLIALLGWITLQIACYPSISNGYVMFIYSIIVCIIVPNTGLWIIYHKSECFKLLYNQIRLGLSAVE